MEPEQAGAVESPGSLLSNGSVRGLHGLFSGRKRRVTPTRRERVEQESPLLLSLTCFLPSPYPPATKPAPQ
jgi:hypothetical protein